MSEIHHTDLTEGVSTLSQRANQADKIIIATIIGFILLSVGEALELAGVIDVTALELDALATAYVFTSLISIGIFILSVIFVAMWIHRAHANLHESGVEMLNFTPGWAVGWYFIPIMNLFKPFQAMRELWTESRGVADSYASEAPGSLGLWWGAWIAGNILGNVSTRMSMMGDGSNLQVGLVLALASSVCTITSAVILRNIIREITEAQISGVTVAKVFE